MPPAKRPSPKRPAKRAPPKPAASLVGGLAEAAWLEADSALAEALVECDQALSAKSERARRDALDLLSLALSRAARRRGFSRVGKKGAIEDFDTKRHDLATSPKRAPKRVRIALEGVARGREVLIKARVTSERAKRS